MRKTTEGGHSKPRRYAADTTRSHAVGDAYATAVDRVLDEIMEHLGDGRYPDQVTAVLIVGASRRALSRWRDLHEDTVLGTLFALGPPLRDAYTTHCIQADPELTTLDAMQATERALLTTLTPADLVADEVQVAFRDHLDDSAVHRTTSPSATLGAGDAIVETDFAIDLSVASSKAMDPGAVTALQSFREALAAAAKYVRRQYDARDDEPFDHTVVIGTATAATELFRQTHHCAAPLVMSAIVEPVCMLLLDLPANDRRDRALETLRAEKTQLIETMGPPPTYGYTFTIGLRQRTATHGGPSAVGCFGVRRPDDA